jgi:hypothetical protein
MATLLRSVAVGDPWLGDGHWPQPAARGNLAPGGRAHNTGSNTTVRADLGDVISTEAVETKADEVNRHLTSLKGGFELHTRPSKLLLLASDATPPLLIDLWPATDFVDVPHLRALLPSTTWRRAHNTGSNTTVRAGLGVAEDDPPPTTTSGLPGLSPFRSSALAVATIQRRKTRMGRT